MTVRAWLGVLATGAALACGATPIEAPEPASGCAALLEAARRAEGCDPALRALADRIQAAPDEPACRVAARRLLADDSVRAEARLQSLYEPPAEVDAEELTADERRELADLQLPAQIHVAPDLRPGPGVPPTTAMIDDATLAPDDAGVLAGFAMPGARTLRVRHAGREGVYCVELRACETTRVVAHGATLARDPRVGLGPC